MIANKIIASTAILSTMAFGLPVLAWHGNDVTVTNSNGAEVINEVIAVASTGYNSASGGSAYAGNGGDVTDSDDDNMGGWGGMSGSGGRGGSVDTGNAEARANITNDVNYNETDVTVMCGCVEEEDEDDEDDHEWHHHGNKGDVDVSNSNGAFVANGVGLVADTGLNWADGGSADAGNGGDVDNSDDDNMGGNGGDSENGGNGGDVTTGNSSARADIVNLVNTNITRVTR